MSTYSTEAVILRARDFGEADRLVTLYTLDQGKITAKVRGARRPRSKLGGITLPLTYVDVMLWRGRSSIESLTQAVPRDGFAPLRAELGRLGHANLVAELVDLLTLERVPSPPTFVALLSTINLIAYGERSDMPAYAFALRMLRDAGVLAGLDTCVSCGRPIETSASQESSPALLGWSAEAAGPLCGECVGGGAADDLPGEGRGGPHRGLLLMLRPDTLGYLRQLIDASPRALAALRPGPAALRQIRTVLWDCFGANLERPPRSLGFLDTIVPLA